MLYSMQSTNLYQDEEKVDALAKMDEKLDSYSDLGHEKVMKMVQIGLFSQKNAKTFGGQQKRQ